MLNHEADYIYSTMYLRESIKRHWTPRDSRWDSGSVSYSLYPESGHINSLSLSLFFSKMSTISTCKILVTALMGGSNNKIL